MAFKLKCSLANTTASVEYFNGKKGQAYIYGEALSLSGGALTKCAATTKPEYICLSDKVCTDDSILVPVMRVMDFYLFECPVTGDVSAITAGEKVTIDTNGAGVTSTTTNGVAEIITIDGNTATVKF